MSLITIIVLSVILVIQQLQLLHLNKQVNILASVCVKLQMLNDKQIQGSKDMLELIKLQRDATKDIIDNIASKESKSDDSK